LPCEQIGKRRFVHVPTAREWRASQEGKRLRYQPERLRDDPAECGTIYGWVDPRTGKVVYIGKTRNLRKRLKDYRHKAHGVHLDRWMRKLKRLGLKPELRVLEECLFDLSGAERKWIAHGRAKGWPLMNQTEGGDGGSHYNEVQKQQIAERTRAKWEDPMYRLRWFSATAKRYGMPFMDYMLRCIENRKPRAPRAIQQPSKAAIERAKREEAKLLERTLTPLTCHGAAFVPLTQRQWAIIDAEDWDRTSRHEWSYAADDRAKRTMRHPDGRVGCEVLGRFIMRATDRQMVVYQNDNGLDCRKANLVLLNQKGGRPRFMPQWRRAILAGSF